MSFLGTIKAFFSDTESDYARMDASTHALETIDYPHHEIHSGSHFFIEGYAELDDGDDLHVKLVTPSGTEYSHFRWEIASSGILTTTLDEDATGGMAGGGAKVPINNNRNSANTSGMVITAGVTACTGYTLRIAETKMGGVGHKQSSGGVSGRDDEIILKADTVYCRSFTSGSDDNIVSFKASWYEHTDRN